MARVVSGCSDSSGVVTTRYWYNIFGLDPFFFGLPETSETTAAWPASKSRDCGGTFVGPPRSRTSARLA